jgi:uncharacterized protein (DUF736 family)
VKIGAGWKKSASNGTNYISVLLNNDARLAIFANKNKEKENQPDYELLMDLDTAEALGLISEYDWKRIYGEKPTPQSSDDEINIEDIPF